MHGWLGRVLCAMFIDAPWMPTKTWNYAAILASLCISLVPRQQKDPSKTPYEKFFETKPDLIKLKLMKFGQPVEFLLPPDRQTKLHAKTLTGAYLGPCVESKGAILVYNFETQRVRATLSYWEHLVIPPQWAEWNNADGMMQLFQTDDDVFEDEPPTQPREGSVILPSILTEPGIGASGGEKIVSLSADATAGSAETASGGEKIAPQSASAAAGGENSGGEVPGSEAPKLPPQSAQIDSQPTRTRYPRKANILFPNGENPAANPTGHAINLRAIQFHKDRPFSVFEDTPLLSINTVRKHNSELTPTVEQALKSPHRAQ